MPGVRLMDWARILAFVTGAVDQELLARIEYLSAENRILKAQLKGRLKLSDAERATLAELGHRLGRKRGLVTYYVLFFIHLESRRVVIAGITVHPDEPWMRQIARNVTMEGCGAIRGCRYLLHDRDTKFTQSFRAIIASGRVEPLVLPAHSPNLNAYAERWVRSVKEECLSKVVLFGERSLRRALSEYVEHYHAERNHRGKGNILLFPQGTHICRDGPVQCRERLGGLLRYYYHQEAA